MEGVNRNTEFVFKISLKNFVIKTTSLVICQKPVFGRNIVIILTTKLIFGLIFFVTEKFSITKLIVRDPYLYL